MAACDHNYEAKAHLNQTTTYFLSIRNAVDFLVLWGLVVPEENSRLLRTAKRQARALSDLSGCKLNQAQMTLAIDIYGYMSWAKLKNAIESDELPSSLACLLDRDYKDPALIISVIRSHWRKWTEDLAKISYLQEIPATVVLSSILNIDELELNRIIGLD